ncbi:MAG TPA: hypothetical protein VKA01_05700 [Vicinamibacteria bacterium]|nr:hypothetical protein [Vicinamibacteria bacterium]
MFAGRAWPTALLSCVLASPSAAQTPDASFAGYSFAPPSVGSRPAGLGGAFVGLADDAKAAAVNPAGLTLIPLTELSVSSGERWAAVSAGRRLFRLAGYATHVDSKTASLDSSVLEGGLATGVRPFRRASLGIGVAWSRLSLEATSRPAGAPPSSEDTQVRFTAGVLLDLLDTTRRKLPALRLGLAYQRGFDWSLSLPPSPSPAPAPVDVRRPSLLAAGLALRPSDRWTLLVQGDLIRYREVIETLGRNSGTPAVDWSLPDVVEPRVGMEFTAPLWCGCGVVRLRSGLHYRSSGSLRYVGTDPALARAFDHDPWETVASLGGSFFTEHFGHALRIDLDSRDLFHGPDLSFGLVFRF